MTKKNANVLIGGLQKSSLIDYPGKISAIIFTHGCNFRCPYCHNPEIITKTNGALIDVSFVLDFLSSRQGKLDGVVITGGEPTLQKDLPEFIKEIKYMGFAVKLDTNGTNPKMLQRLIDEKLIDYVAMDIKSPIEKYEKVTCSKVNSRNILKSVEILKNSALGHEFRTTVVKSQLASEDFEKIGQLLEGEEKYYLQRFVPTKTLDKTFIWQETYTDEEFGLIIKSLRKKIKCVELR